MSWIQYLLTFASTAAAAATAAQHRCGLADPSEDARREQHAKVAAYFNGTTSMAEADTTIQTYVHVVTTDAKYYNYPLTMVRDQMALLNRVFGNFGFHFQLAGTDYTANDAWARTSVNTAAEREMRTALQKGNGDYTVLNLYFLSDIAAETSEPLLGVCTFPVAQPTQDQRLLDGCLNGADTMPGGASQRFGLGFTAAHEVGHWFYLFHTFAGNNCDGYGDGISDTPAEKYSTSGCPSGKDTCPTHPGADPIHNIMDYSDDNCLTSFTTGQSNLARKFYTMYRVPNANNA